MNAFTKVNIELRERARREARDPDYEPIVNTDQLRDGSWLRISAITPRREVFYWMMMGPYDVRGRNTILESRDELSVCRFTISPDRSFREPPVPDLSWIALPEPDCGAPLETEIKRVSAWRSQRSKAVYKVLGEVKADNLHTWLIEQSNVHYPFDASGAATSILGRNDRVISATAVGSFHRPISYLTSRSGRIMVGFHDSSAATRAYPACIVEGVKWSDLVADARSASPAMIDARQLCSRLVRSHRESEGKRLERDLTTNPITTHPLEPRLR